MKVHPLYEGSFSVDASKKFIPFDPQKDDPKDRKASIFIYVQPFLVETGSALILFDAGLGQNTPEGKLMLHENIRKAGFEPDEVDMVLMSHLHADHSGGLVYEKDGELVPSFPEAKHMIQKDEWEFSLSGKSGSYPKEIFEALKDNVELDLIEGSGEYTKHIRYELTGAHCPFHQVFWLEENGEIVFFGGDVLPEPEQAIRKFAAKYDYDGRKAMELRAEYAKQANEENWLCLFYHGKSRATGHIRIDANGGVSVV